MDQELSFLTGLFSDEEAALSSTLVSITLKKELEGALQEAKQQDSKADKRQNREETLRRSKRIAVAHQKVRLKESLEMYQSELRVLTKKWLDYRTMLEPPTSARPIADDFTRMLEASKMKLELLHWDLLNSRGLFQSEEGACHSTSAGKLREGPQ